MKNNASIINIANNGNWKWKNEILSDYLIVYFNENEDQK